MRPPLHVMENVLYSLHLYSFRYADYNDVLIILYLLYSGVPDSFHIV